MGFVYQIPAVVGGTVLVIERIQSQNYQAGVMGWAIYADGDAEFNNVTARGELIVGTSPGQYVLIGRDSLGRPIIQLSSGDVNETDPGYLRTSPSGQTRLEIVSPLNANAPVGSIRPEIDLQSWPGSASSLNLWADQIFVNVPVLLEQGWTKFTDVGVFSGTWSDVAGARAGFFKDATGRVQLRGQVVGGAAAQIGVMPAGYRPTQTMEWIMRGQGGVIMCAVTVATTGVITASANAGTAQSAGVRLDSISYPVEF